MNSYSALSMVRPNTPLRRPSSSPGDGVVPPKAMCLRMPGPGEGALRMPCPSPGPGPGEGPLRMPGPGEGALRMPCPSPGPADGPLRMPCPSPGDLRMPGPSPGDGSLRMPGPGTGALRMPCPIPGGSLGMPGPSPSPSPSPADCALTDAPERPLAPGNADGDAGFVKDHSVMATMPTAVAAKFCNYCGLQGSLRCTRCKKAFYCSVACQTEHWKTHRDVCMLSGTAPSVPQLPKSVELKESPKSPQMANGHASDSKEKHSDVTSPPRVYLRDLRRNNVGEGAELQASVVEFRNPGRFYIHVQSPALTEALRTVTMEMCRMDGSPGLGTPYLPEQGQVCAVRFSLDKNWYRGLVQSVSADQTSASVLYIDFGNEEEVPLDRIRPLAADMEPFPPCAWECSVSGVTPVTGGSWTGECCIAVSQLVAGKSLKVTMVTVQESDRTYAVDVLLSSTGQLSMFLIQQGYAVKEVIKRDIGSLESASLAHFRHHSGGKNENTEALPPAPLTQGLGDTFDAVVTHLQSPYDIICQKLDNTTMIQELQLQLREYCSKAPASTNFRPAPGTVCCSLFSEDNQWYRAKVLGYSSKERVCVGYVDFGNSEEVDLGHLRPLSPELLALPTQAFRCSLAGVRPVSESWSDDCGQVLRKLVGNRFLRVEILGERNGTALVNMVDEATDPQATVAELLISAGCALPDSKPTDSGPAGAKPAVKEPLEWSCAELPSDGQEVALLISVVENPGEFYCYIYNPTVKPASTLAGLRVELTQHCEADHTPFTPTVGEPCCAKFSGDGAWYRGVVQGVCGEKANIYFADYGNLSEVETTHLRAITPSLLKLPFLAVRCCLAGVEPVGSKWSSDALRCFQTLAVGQQLRGRVVSISERGYGVELESDGQNIATKLLSERLAKAPGETQTPAASITPQQQHPAPPPKESTAGAGPPKATATVQKETRVEEKPKPVGQRQAGSEAVASFPVDWRTEELALNKPFQPRVAAVVSPSLFYVFNLSQVDLEKLQQMMRDVAVYCTSQASPSQSKPKPGAACCAQFSADKNWYRAVILETSETEASVIYADYGNSETVAFSSILPIPSDLLQLPFLITRCALMGKERFPVVWPVEVLELCGALLSAGVTATVQAFDGDCNLLSVTLHQERGGGHLNSMILEGLQGTSTTLSPEPKGLQSTSTTLSPEPKGLQSTSTTLSPEPSTTAAATPEPERIRTTLATPIQSPSVDKTKPATAPGTEHQTTQKNSEPKHPQSTPHSQSTDGAKPAVKEPLEWSCAELPSDGQEVALLISVVENPGEFYCYIYNPTDFQGLMELGVELKEHCEADGSLFTPTVGEPCCAKFSGDGDWYRGVVQGVCGEKANIYFADYGNLSEVETTHLRAITPSLLKLPFLAVRCCLAGVEPVGSKWSSDALRCFQTLAVGQQLRGRVVSISERGYGVELESDGQNIATKLLSERLAKAPGETQTPAASIIPQQQHPTPPPKESTAGAGPPKATATIQKETRVEEKPKPVGQRQAGSEAVASFPVDWRTEELALNKPFQPRVAAVVSPSLFYVFNLSQVDLEKLQQMMRDVAVYCTSQASPSQSKPKPGAACCAQFSADGNWYRAVVLETSETEASVIYADYGNSETVAFSSILPIPSDLLQLPFLITRCALMGKERFPAVWPVEVLELCGALLSAGVTATVQAFDGDCNLLSVTLHQERGGGHLNSMILEGLQSTSTTPEPTGLQSTSTTPEPTGLQSTSTTPEPTGLQSTSTTLNPKPKGLQTSTTLNPEPSTTAAATPEPERIRTTLATPVQTHGQSLSVDKTKPATAAVTEHQTIQKNSEPKHPQSIPHSQSTDGSPCCCLQLKMKIDSIEEMMLSLMKELRVRQKC